MNHINKHSERDLPEDERRGVYTSYVGKYMTESDKVGLGMLIIPTVASIIYLAAVYFLTK